MKTKLPNPCLQPLTSFSSSKDLFSVDNLCTSQTLGPKLSLITLSPKPGLPPALTMPEMGTAAPLAAFALTPHPTDVG